jgi:hypothetical protein
MDGGFILIKLIDRQSGVMLMHVTSVTVTASAEFGDLQMGGNAAVVLDLSHLIHVFQ